MTVPSGARWLVAAALIGCAASACKKSGGNPPAARDGGGVVATGPDGAPLVATGWTAGVSPGTLDPTLRACRVGLRTGWGPADGPLAGLPMMMRTYRAHGTRAEVLAYAKEHICQEAGLTPEQCTDDKFDTSLERCDGDPRRERPPLSPEAQQLADQILAGAVPIDAGAPGAADAAVQEDRVMPAFGPDGEQLIY